MPCHDGREITPAFRSSFSFIFSNRCNFSNLSCVTTVETWRSASPRCRGVLSRESNRRYELSTKRLLQRTFWGRYGAGTTRMTHEQFYEAGERIPRALEVA